MPLLTILHYAVRIQDCRKFIESKYLESCKYQNKDTRTSKKIIDWFFNRLDNFDNYINYFIKHDAKYPIPKGVKRERLYYACDQCNLNYFIVKGWVELYQIENTCNVLDYEL